MMKYFNNKLTELQLGATVKIPKLNVYRVHGSPLNLI